MQIFMIVGNVPTFCRSIIHFCGAVRGWDRIYTYVSFPSLYTYVSKSYYGWYSPSKIETCRTWIQEMQLNAYNFQEKRWRTFIVLDLEKSIRSVSTRCCWLTGIFWFPNWPPWANFLIVIIIIGIISVISTIISWSTKYKTWTKNNLIH